MATLALLNVTLWGWDQESESSVAALAARTQAVYRKHCLHSPTGGFHLAAHSSGKPPQPELQSFNFSCFLTWLYHPLLSVFLGKGSWPHLLFRFHPQPSPHWPLNDITAHTSVQEVLPSAMISDPLPHHLRPLCRALPRLRPLQMPSPHSHTRPARAQAASQLKRLPTMEVLTATLSSRARHLPETLSNRYRHCLIPFCQLFSH